MLVSIRAKDRWSMAALAVCGLAGGVAVQAGPALSAGADAGAASSGTSSETGSSSGGGEISEIVVTAERREEKLSRVGATVSAVTAKDLERIEVHEASDLARVVPAFQAAASSVSGAPAYFLRGVGFATQNIGVTAPVGLYVNEVAYAYPYMGIGELFDLERVEVLKGPQGTLYGRNTTGGLIDYVAAKPTDREEASLTAGGGNFSSFQSNGFISGPLTEGLKGRLAFDTEHRNDGWQESVSRPGDTLGKLHRTSVRGTLQWDPTSSFHLTGTASYWVKMGDTQAGQAVAEVVGTPSPAVLASLLPNPTSNRQADWVPQSDQPQSNITGFIRPPDTIHSDVWTATVKMAYDLTDSTSLASLSSYQNLHADQCLDAAGVQVEQVVQCNHDVIHTISEELRLLGNQGPVRWSVGGYFAHDSASGAQHGYAGELPTILGLRYFAHLLPSTYTAQQIDTSYRLYGAVGDTVDRVYAGFANLDYTFNPQWKLGVGGRYTSDQVKFFGAGQEQYGNNLAVINTVFPVLVGYPVHVVENGSFSLNPTNTGFAYVNQSQTQGNFAWRAHLDWTPDPDQLYYVGISRGYKSGSFPTLAASTVTQLTPVTQEQLTDYEIGAKISLAGRRVLINTSVYYYDYQNRQVYGQVKDLIFGTLPRVVNIPKSTNYGIDGDLTWRALDTLTVQVGFNEMRARIKEFTGYDETGTVRNFDGQPVAFSPDFQAFASVLDTIPLNGTYSLEPSVDVSYQSKSYSYIGSLDQYRIDPYTLVGGSLSLVGNTEKTWRVTAYVRNATDKYYWTSAQLSHDTIARFTGMPRTYGVRGTINF